MGDEQIVQDIPNPAEITGELEGDASQPLHNMMKAVTVSREYGSGGGEIASRLAERLGWHLVDREVVEEVARSMGISENDAEAYDEHAETLVSRILSGLTVMQASVMTSLPVQLGTDEPAYDEARRRVVEGAVATGHTVIVGRGAQALLAPRRDVLHVRVIAPLDQRITYVMKREGLSHAAAEQRIRNKDQQRAHFLMAVNHQNPADARLYDLVVNTGVLHLNSAVDLIVLALDRKARRLVVPVEALGPGAGMARYAEAPGDVDLSPSGKLAELNQ